MEGMLLISPVGEKGARVSNGNGVVEESREAGEGSGRDSGVRRGGCTVVPCVLG